MNLKLNPIDKLYNLPFTVVGHSAEAEGKSVIFQNCNDIVKYNLDSSETYNDITDTTLTLDVTDATTLYLYTTDESEMFLNGVRFGDDWGHSYTLNVTDLANGDVITVEL